MGHYIVTGAAGHLGSTIIKELLLDPSNTIDGLLYYGEKPYISDEHVHYWTGDVSDKTSLSLLFHQANDNTIVIHTAALISISMHISDRLYKTNVVGVENIIELCRAYHVKRLVHVSSVHAIPELQKGQIMHEIEHYDPRLVKGGYAKTKAKGAMLVQTNTDIDSVIVLPSGIIGPYDDGKNHLVQLVKAYVLGKSTTCVRGGYDFVDVRDVAHGVILACEKGKTHESYILSGHYNTVQNLLKEAGKEVRKEKMYKVPMAIAKFGAPFIGIYSKVKKQRPLYTSYALYTLDANSLFSHEKAEKELGYTVRSQEETIHDMVQYLLSRHHTHKILLD